MSIPYICKTCRTALSLSRTRTRRLQPVQSTRWETTSAHHGTEFIDRLGLRGTWGAGESLNNSGDPVGNNSVRGRYSGKELSPQELLDQLDRPSHSRPAVRSPASRPRQGFHGRMTDKNHDLQERGNATTLSTAVAASSRSFVDYTNTTDFPRAWAALQLLAQECREGPSRKLGILLRSPGFTPALHKFIKATIGYWLNSLTTEASTYELPAPRAIFQLLYTMNISKPSLFRPALWQVASGICDAHITNLSQAKLYYAACELTEMWRLTIALQYTLRASKIPQEGSVEHVKSFQNVSATDGTDWKFLTSAESLTTETRGTFSERLNHLLPISKIDLESGNSRRLDYASAAFLTLDMLRSVRASSDVNPDNGSKYAFTCAPFIDLLESILKASSTLRMPIGLQEKLDTIEDERLKKHYSSVVQRLQLETSTVLPVEDVSKALGTDQDSVGVTGGIDLHISSNDSTSLEAAPESQRPNPMQNSIQTQAERFVAHSIKRLARAVEKQDMHLAERIRKEVYAFAGANGNDPMTVPLDLYEHLMLTFLTLRNPKAAVDIWNHIIKTGFTPTVKTYTVMMRGAQASRDVTGMEAFWQKLRNAGYQPDEYAWSVRIFGLLKLKLIPRGLQALNEMGQEWISAARSKASQTVPSSDSLSTLQLLSQYPDSIDKIPRPNLVVMNSAISALASKAEHEVPRVLAWGRSFGIDPDVSTYNTLLNIAMRHGQADEASRILRRMSERGVEANSTTWTVLVTALFHGGFLDGLDNREQEKKIIGFIESLEHPDSGIPALDDKAYALVIDRLLKTHKNPSAANAVLAHMTATGRTPSTHIYTILISSHFQQQPQPDLGAIENIWKQIQAQNAGYGAPVDTIFYDRMIEGYAAHHRLAGLQPALDFLKRARQAGQRPGWRALEAVARALADRQEWNRLRALVDDVRISLRKARGATQHTGQRSFWSFIFETGLLRDEGITRPEQLMPAQPRTSPLLEVADS